MAKAQFQKGQKVWVECVGAWAAIERVAPVWAKGFDEPVRITYDVGFGREFTAEELQAEPSGEAEGGNLGDWRLMRARNKWQAPEDCAHHPHPGTFPVVVTDKTDWGGWRVPGAEYDRDPHGIEHQARLIAAAPKLMKIAEELVRSVMESPDDAPPELLRIAKACESVLRAVGGTGAPPRLAAAEPVEAARPETRLEPAAPNPVLEKALQERVRRLSA